MRYDLKKQLRSFRYAFQGLRTTFLKEQNLSFHYIAALVVIILGFVCHLKGWEWAAVLVAIGLVISLELVNTAIEQIVDMVSPERRKEAGRIKDIAAGAVLFSALCAAGIGLVVFLPHLIG